MKFKTTNIALAYEALGVIRFEFPSLPGLPEEKRIRLQAQLDLETFIEAVNQESNGGKLWRPDYEDGTTKYEPWFYPVKSDAHPSGFVFSHSYYGYTDTRTYCGSRFAFHSVDAWRHAVNTPEAIDLFLMVWTKKD